MTFTVPIACTLSAKEFHRRQSDLLPGLACRATDVERLTNGLRLRFAPGSITVGDIARVVDAERQCCRFLGFDIVAEPDAGPLGLTITAPADAQELLADLMKMSL
jgi:hypothetical protein